MTIMICVSLGILAVLTVAFGLWGLACESAARGGDSWDGPDLTTALSAELDRRWELFQARSRVLA
jgi:hypothetical protein